MLASYDGLRPIFEAALLLTLNLLYLFYCGIQTCDQDAWPIVYSRLILLDYDNVLSSASRSRWAVTFALPRAFVPLPLDRQLERRPALAVDDSRWLSSKDDIPRSYVFK